MNLSAMNPYRYQSPKFTRSEEIDIDEFCTAQGIPINIAIGFYFGITKFDETT